VADPWAVRGRSVVCTDVAEPVREDDVPRPQEDRIPQENTMDFTTISALASERQATLRRDGEQVRQGRIARLRRAARNHDRSPSDTR
jgi:hypothetical protein